MHLREVCIPEKGASFFLNDISKDVNLPGQNEEWSQYKVMIYKKHPFSRTLIALSWQKIFFTNNRSCM